MAIHYDIATRALIFNDSDPRERKTALMYMIVMNTDDKRPLSEIRKRITLWADFAKFTAQEYADAVQMGMSHGFLTAKFPAGVPETAVHMAITEYIGKAALEYPESLVPCLDENGTRILKEMGR